MHRTFSVPCRIGWWTLLVAGALQVGIHAASAQASLQPAHYFTGPNDNPQMPVITMAVGASQTCAMSSRADLKRVENPNSKVVRVGRTDKNNEILLVAEYPGRAMVTLIDQRDHVEVHEVVVTGEVLQDPKNIVRVRLERGDQRTFKLEKPALGGLRITKSEIVDIRVSQTDPKTFTAVAIGSGTTRVFFYTDKAQQEILAIYEFEVPAEDAIGQLREFIRTIPTAGVTATPIKLPTDKDKRNEKAENGVILMGRVTNVSDATAIVAVAKRLFPATIMGQQTTMIGPQATSQDLLRDNVINYIQIGGVQQVQLEVVVAIVNRTRVRNMSFSFTANGNDGFISSILGGPATFTNNIATGNFNSLTPSTGSSITSTGSFNIPFGVINNRGNFFGFLQLLTTEGVTKILAEPRVTTLSGRPANFTSGGQTPILTSSGVGAPSVSYQNFGTVVSCLPIVQGNGKILLEVKADISDINPANGINIAGTTPTSVPGFDIRTAQVTIQVEDGQTMAIGGLIQNKTSATISKIPVLGDLPFVSPFFTSKTYNENEEEMIILVTPRLVDPIDCSKFPKFLPGRETRVPDDFEFFLEGILEAPRKPRDVIFHPHLYQAAYKNAPNVGQIPCADGNCGRAGAGCATGNCGAPAVSGSLMIPAAPTTGSAGNFAAPQTVAAPSVPALPTSSTGKIVVEPAAPAVTPTTREIPPSFGPAAPIAPTIPSAPPRELQNRPVLPPLSATPYTPN